MNDNYIQPFDHKVCRQIINRLRDGEPPPFEAIEFLSVGYQSHFKQVMDGFKKAQEGGYSIMLLEGPYGIGKSHLLRYISVIAEQQNFVVKYVEIGKGRVYFNNPDGIYQMVANGDHPPIRYIWRGDRLRKFVGELKALTEMYVKNGKSGLVILLDEMENTVNNLYTFLSRAKAYRFLGTLFKGCDEGGHGYILYFENMMVVMATTPGTIDTAVQDGYWCFTSNPAANWLLPAKQEIKPLGYDDAFELAQRVRSIHNSAFNWLAQNYVDDSRLQQICRDWLPESYSKGERELVKKIIETLEIAEQNR